MQSNASSRRLSEDSPSQRAPWLGHIPFCSSGDLDAFAAVFSNNLATLLVGVGLIQEKVGRERIYAYVIPGCAAAMTFGNLYYIVQAILRSRATGRANLCAQPFGINTPGVFAFAFSIIYPVYYDAGGGNGDPSTEEAAQQLAWNVGVMANLVQGLLEVALSAIGPLIAGLVPMVALLGSLASIGITFLFTNSLLGEMYAPLVGLIPFYMILMAMYSNVKVPRVPAMYLPVLVATVAAWIRKQPGLASVEALRAGAKEFGWHPCAITLDGFGHLGEVSSYLPVVFPVALTVAVGTIQCRELAARAGDDYSLRGSMLGDGMATVLAALCVSPFGMTVFIGHPGCKAMGAKLGYNMLVAFCFAVVSFSGVAGVFQAVFPPETLNPILLFIGLAVCSDALEVTPPRHWPAFMLSLVPCFANWATTLCQNFAANSCNFENSTCIVPPTSSGAWTLDSTGALRGLFALGQGYLLISILLSSMLVHVIDRHFRRAAAWAFVATFSSSIGLVHSEKLFFPWDGPSKPQGYYNSGQFDLHWDFTAAYGGLCVLFVVLDIFSCHGLILRGPLTVLEQHRTATIDGSVMAQMDSSVTASLMASEMPSAMASGYRGSAHSSWQA